MWSLLRGVNTSSLAETSKWVLTRMLRKQKKFLKYAYFKKRNIFLFFNDFFEVNFQCVFVGDIILSAHFFQLSRNNWIRVLKFVSLQETPYIILHPTWVCQENIMIWVTLFKPLLLQSLLPFIKFVKYLITLAFKLFFSLLLSRF